MAAVTLKWPSSSVTHSLRPCLVKTHTNGPVRPGRHRDGFAVRPGHHRDGFAVRPGHHRDWPIWEREIMERYCMFRPLQS